MATTMRNYFYTICHNGRLFTADVTRRNMASCLKDPYFIDFFLKRVKPIAEVRQKARFDQYFQTAQEETGVQSAAELDALYPYVSVCGRELNFVAPSETVVVFNRKDEHKLYYGGNLDVDLDPANLAVSEAGKLYHRAPVGRWGLINSHMLDTDFADLLSYTDSGAVNLTLQGNTQVLPLLSQEELSPKN